MISVLINAKLFHTLNIYIYVLPIGIDFGQNNYHAMALFLLYPQGIEKQKAALSVLEDAAFTSNVKII